MKIVRIFLRNLNSLQGDFLIDLEKEPFASSGLFAITGPTGAGKSTILDAITLALYGRAARYGNDKPENMMSRGSGECQAEVEFIVPKGRFRAVWLLKRARGKAEGKLQPVQRFLYDAQNEVLAQKIHEVDQKIEEVTGLGADQFFRSVLLAQGDFVKFLKAAPDERASLLENLTGTEIYSEISVRAHIETGKKERAVELRQKQLDGTVLLNCDEKLSLEKILHETADQIHVQGLQELRLIKDLKLANELQKHTQLKKGYLRDLDTIKLERQKAEPQIQKLHAYHAAQPYFLPLQQVESLQKTLSDQRKQVQESEQHLTHTKQLFHNDLILFYSFCKKSLREAENVKDQHQLSHSRLLQVQEDLKTWLANHQLDNDLEKDLSFFAAKSTSYVQYQQQKKVKIAHLNDLKKSLEKEKKACIEQELIKANKLLQIKELESQLDTEKNHLNALLQGQSPSELKTTLKDKQQLFSLCKQRDIFLASHQKLSRENAEAAAAVFHNQTLEKNVATELAEAEEHLAQEKTSLVSCKTAWDEAKYRSSFEEHRQNLLPGHSCPLCGSYEHASLLIEARSPSEFETKFKEQEALVTSLEKSCRILFNNHAKISATLIQKNENLEEKILQVALHLQEYEKFIKDNNFESLPTDSLEKEILSFHTHLEKIDIASQKILSQQNTRADIVHSLELVENTLSHQNIKICDQSFQLQTGEVEIFKLSEQIEECAHPLAKKLEKYKLVLPKEGEEKNLLLILNNRKKTYFDTAHRFQTQKLEIQNTFSAITEYNNKIASIVDKIIGLELIFNKYNLLLIIKESTSVMTDEKPEDNLRQSELKLTSAESALAESKKALRKAENELQAFSATFYSSLSSSSFENIENLKKARLTTEEFYYFQKIEHDNKALFDRCQGQISAADAEIMSLLQNKAPEEKEIPALESGLKELTKELINLRSLATLTANKLSQDQHDQLTHRTLFDEIELDKKHLSSWQRLSALIGSCDGKNFRKFAQGLSLDLLIRHANTHLKTLSDRYSLKRVPGEVLDMEIQDHHQANSTRPIASLSGGESFLTSLAMALGLSDLAGKNVRIDSLFIDEGFGSLDSEALEMAVQALESLRAKNKTIGIISHVELLKERISTQIRVQKGLSGVSTLSFML